MRIRKQAVAVAAGLALWLTAGCATHDGAAQTDSPHPAATTGPAPSTADARGGVPVSVAGVGVVGAGDVIVDVYIEPLCQPCAVFETSTGQQLAALTAEPGVTVVYHVVSFLDPRFPDGDGYSLRAAAALAVVADQAPDQYAAFLTALFEHQTEAKAGAHSNSDIAAWARDVGVPEPVVAQLDGTSPSFTSFVEATTANARDDLAAVGGLSTPTVMVDGTKADWSDATALLATIEAARR